jgi:hypothetical protein
MPNQNVDLLAKALRESVRSVRGVTSLALRRGIFDRAAAGVRGEAAAAKTAIDAVVDAVVDAPHQADVEGLLKLGKSEDEVYEIVVTAAVGAGFARVEKAIALLAERNK